MCSARLKKYSLMFLMIPALFCTSFLAAAKKPPVNRFLEGRIPPGDKRYVTMVSALQLIQAREAVNIIETGTSRFGASEPIGDGAFTIILGDYIRDMKGSNFYSVDISSEALAKAAEALGPSRDFVNLINEDSVTFLKNFKEPIDFLYLDSYDLDIENPIPSQHHHLKEIIAAYPNLTKKSVVMIDDCGFPNGGKGKYVIEYLLARGWKIRVDGYQVILTQ